MANGETKSFWEKVQSLDRRIVFLFIALAVAIPLLFHVVFPEKITPIVAAIFDRVDALPEGSKVLISFDYAPSTVPEIQPMVDAMIRHCATKKLKIYIMALWPTGQNIADDTIDRVLKPEFPDYRYGIDYVNIGYKSGNQGLINVILTDLKRMYTTDVNGTAIDSIPMMEPIRNLRNFDIIVWRSRLWWSRLWRRFPGRQGMGAVCGRSGKHPGRGGRDRGLRASPLSILPQPNARTDGRYQGGGGV